MVRQKQQPRKFESLQPHAQNSQVPSDASSVASTSRTISDIGAYDVTKARRAGRALAQSRPWKAGIRRILRRNDFAIPCAIFHRFIRKLAQELCANDYNGFKYWYEDGKCRLRMQALALDALQEATETFLTLFFEDIHLAALHCKRVTAQVEDARLAMDDDDDVETSKFSTSGADWINSIPAGAGRNVRDISTQAVWSLSSCKTGFGVHELLDDSVERYWQSDGPQPHTVAIEFPCKTDISYLLLYLDYKTDESYTPSKVIVYLGSSLMNLDEGLQVNFNEPSQWQVIDLRSQGGRPARAFVIQLQVVQNHQNGRDTHIRHMRVIGPSKSRFDVASRSLATSQALDVNDTVPNTLLSKKMSRLMTLR